MWVLKSAFEKYKHQLLLVLVVLIAWWPLASFYFVPKWDNIDCYLPYRYFVSWSEWHGYAPLWNPFQHMGYPAYSDMQNGMYSPIVQLLILFGGYSPTSLIIELLSYVVLAALGAYQLSSLFISHRTARFIVGLSFGLSGFMLGTSQIMIFLAGAAFLPFVLYHFYLLLAHGKWGNLLALVGFISLHVTVASPAYTIVLVYLLFTALLLFIWFKKEIFIKYYLKRWIWQLPLVGIFSVLLLLPYIFSVVDFLPYFGRSNQLEYGEYLLQNPFDWHSWFSFVFPYPTLANSKWFGMTDLTMRSAYIGVLTLLFALLSLRFIKEKKVAVLWLGFVVFLLVSAGGTTPLYRIVYELPGFGLFRHPSLFRAHLILCLVLLAGIGMERWKKERNDKLLKSGLIVLILIALCVFVWSAMNPYTNDLKSLFSWQKVSEEWKPNFMKTYFFLNSLVVLILGSVAFLIIHKKWRLSYLSGLMVLDLLIYSQITMPATVYAPYTRSDYESYFKALPEIPDQSSARIAYKELVENYEPKMMGIWRNTATYHKSLTFDGHNQTQFIAFNAIEQNGGMPFAKENPLFYEVSERIDLKTDTLKRPHCLWRSDAPLRVNPDTLQVTHPNIGFNRFSVRVVNKSVKSDLLILNQNFHHGWSASLNGRSLRIHRVNEAFMGVVVPPNSKGKIVFEFDAPHWKKSIWVAVFSWILLVTALFLIGRKTTKKRA